MSRTNISTSWDARGAHLRGRAASLGRRRGARFSSCLGLRRLARHGAPLRSCHVCVALGTPLDACYNTASSGCDPRTSHAHFPRRMGILKWKVARLHWLQVVRPSVCLHGPTKSGPSTGGTGEECVKLRWCNGKFSNPIKLLHVLIFKIINNFFLIILWVVRYVIILLNHLSDRKEHP